MVPPTAPERSAVERYPVRDQGVAATLARDGYAIVPFLDPAELEEVRDVRRRHGEAPGDPRNGFFSDAWTDDRAYRRTVSDELSRVLEGPIGRFTGGHEVLSIGHLVKWPSSESAVVAHRDPSFVDERTHRSLTIWFPLFETGEADGALWVVERSHLGSPPCRPHDDPENLAPTALEDPLAAELLGGRARMLDLPLGSAVVFDHALVHGSPPNHGTSARVSVAVLLVPSDAQAEYTLAVDEQRAEVIAVGPEFFLEHQFQALDPPALLAAHRRIRVERRAVDVG